MSQTVFKVWTLSQRNEARAQSLRTGCKDTRGPAEIWQELSHLTSRQPSKNGPTVWGDEWMSQKA